MARRKYVKDYKLVHSVDEKGKVRTRAEYAGDRFCFVQEREAIRRQAKPAAAACGLAWLCYIGSLLLNTGAMRCFYISLPYVFTALPLWKLSTSVVTILTVEEPMHRRHSHQVSMEYPPAALWTGALPAVSLAVIASRRRWARGASSPTIFSFPCWARPSWPARPSALPGAKFSPQKSWKRKQIDPAFIGLLYAATAFNKEIYNE